MASLEKIMETDKIDYQKLIPEIKNGHAALNKWQNKRVRQIDGPKDNLWTVMAIDHKKQTVTLVKESQAFGKQSIDIPANDLTKWEIVR